MSVIQEGYSAFACMQEIMNAIHNLQISVNMVKNSVTRLEKSVNERIDRLERGFAARISASSHNTMARIQNSRLTSYDAVLVALRDATTNEELCFMPTTARELDNDFTSEDLGALLNSLGVVDTGAEVIEHDDMDEDATWERLRQLARVAVGLTPVR